MSAIQERLIHLLGGLSLEFHLRVSRTAHEPCVRAWGILGDRFLPPFTREPPPNSSIFKSPQVGINPQTKLTNQINK